MGEAKRAQWEKAKAVASGKVSNASGCIQVGASERRPRATGRFARRAAASLLWWRDAAAVPQHRLLRVQVGFFELVEQDADDRAGKQLGAFHGSERQDMARQDRTGQEKAKTGQERTGK